jgi:hypothetical protein
MYAKELKFQLTLLLLKFLFRNIFVEIRAVLPSSLCTFLHMVYVTCIDFQQEDFFLPDCGVMIVQILSDHNISLLAWMRAEAIPLVWMEAECIFLLVWMRAVCISPHLNKNRVYFYWSEWKQNVSLLILIRAEGISTGLNESRMYPFWS